MDSWGLGFGQFAGVDARQRRGSKAILAGKEVVGRGEVKGGVVVVRSMGSLPCSAVTFGGHGVVQVGRRVGARLITLVTKNTENAGSPTPSAQSFPERGTSGPQPQDNAQPKPQTIVPMLYQFRFPNYLPCVISLVNQCAPGRNRTCDQRLRRPLLYPLSYRRMGGSGREDLNLRHLAPKASALPGCATPRNSRFISGNRGTKSS